MTEWNAGYVADIDYLPGFYAEQTPAHLDAALLIRGVEPPVSAGEPFRYCELGCGLGETAAVIAATNPRAAVYGFDFNPAQIARAQAFARAAKLDNLHFAEKSFEELVALDAPALEPFDYITLHGIWTWVSPENRAHIVHFLRRHLRPGGVVLVTYNALPGWTETTPLQRLVKTISGYDASPSDVRVERALGFAEAVAAAGARALPRRLVETLRDKKQTGSNVYLAHEYLNEHWAPAYHADVATDFSAAKLSYVASANYLENFLDCCLTRDQQALLAQVPAAMQETLKDYFLDRAFRRDIFVRGPRFVSGTRLNERQRAQGLTLRIPARKISTKLKVPLGEASLTPSTYEPVFAALAESVRTVGALMDLPALAGSHANPGELIGMSLGSEQAMAAPNTVADADLSVVRAHNLAQFRICAEENRSRGLLAGRAIGSAVHVDLFEMLTYEALASGLPPRIEPIAREAQRLLQQRGGRLHHKGIAIEAHDDTLATLSANVSVVLEEGLPIWRRLGAI